MLLSQPLRLRLSSRRLAWVLAILALGAPATARADGQWLLVSDIHLDPNNRASAPVKPGSDSDPALLASAIAKMRDVDPNPAVVVLAGDFLAHHFKASATGTMASIAHDFGVAFPNARFLIAVGNNDDPCGDYRVSYDSPYLRALAAIWAPLVDRDNASPNFVHDFGRSGSYVASLPMRGARAVVADSVYWSFRYNAACSKIAAPGHAEMEWLRRTLASTPRGERNVVLMHIPPGIDSYSTAFVHGLTTVPFLDATSSASLVGLLRAPSDRVTMVLAGHTHELQSRAFGSVPMLIAPAISPIYGRAPTFLVATFGRDATISKYEGYLYNYRTGVWDRRLPSAIPTSTGRYAVCAATEMTVTTFDRCAGVPNGRLWVEIVLGMVVVLAILAWAIFRLARRCPEVV